MLRTNSKKAKENIRLWILANYTPEDYANAFQTETGEYTLENFPEVAASIMDTFHKEKRLDVKEKGVDVRRYGLEIAFIDWMQGLPSILDIYSLAVGWSASEILGDWLEETTEGKEAYSKKDEDGQKAMKTALHLVFREIQAGVKKFNEHK